MDVNITTHHYDVWVKHNDSPAKPFELLASHFAFRTEQNFRIQLLLAVAVLLAAIFFSFDRNVC